MDYARMMELISLQRHDFLNHFQVISGLLQMNRVEQAREYINQTAGEITRLSRIVHLKVPEAAAAILLAHYDAAERGVNVQYNVEADLGDCIVPAEKTGHVLEMVVSYAVECLARPENTERVIHVIIHTGNGGYLFRVRFTMPPGGESCGKDVLRDIDLTLSLYGGSLQQSTVEENTEIAIFLPAR